MTTDQFSIKNMKTFNSLDADFRRAFKQAAKQGIVKFTVEGIKDDPDSIFIQCLKYRTITLLTIPCRDKRVFV